MGVTTNLRLFKKEYDGFIKDFEDGVRLARNEMANAMEQLAKNEIKGKRKPNEKAEAGQPPKNRTGNLRRSITQVRSRAGFGMYNATVGPTMKYSRAVEEGGKYAPRSWHGTSAMAGFPYMRPAFEKFKKGPMQEIINKYLGEF